MGRWMIIVGAFLVALALVGALVCVIAFQRKTKKLNDQLNMEYGPQLRGRKSKHPDSTKEGT